MPYCQIVTNKTLERSESERMARAASALVAEMVGKPESYVMVRVEANSVLIFGGDDEPTCFVSLASLGLPHSETGNYSRIVCDFIHQELDIATDRVYIEFSSPERHMWGYDRRTFG